jgi:hypothetical protein
MGKNFTWKVVQRHGDVFASTMTHGDALVEYRVGHRSKAPNWLLDEGLGLCCFAAPQQAREFASRFHAPSVMVARCIGHGRMDATVGTPCNIVSIGDGVVDRIENGWWEKGTELFEAVTVVEIVG